MNSKATPVKLLGVALALAVSVLQSTPAAAAPVISQSARVEISGMGKDQIDLEIVSVSDGTKVAHQDWLKENRTKGVIAHFPATGEWSQGSLTIKPAKDGRISVTLLGPYIIEDAATRKARVILIDYDNLQAEGATVKNGGFEKIGADGAPSWFHLSNLTKSNPPLDTANTAAVKTGGAAEGERYIRVWHNSRFGQQVQVTKDTPVTFTFSYRLADAPAVPATANAAAEPAKPWTVTPSDNWKATDQSNTAIVPGSALDLTALFPINREAGADGFALINQRGELAFEKTPDQPVRFLCAALEMSLMPVLTREETEALAEQIARSGYNLVRPHFLELRLMRGAKNDYGFDPETLETWDNLAAALKRRGVYLFIDAMSGKTGFKAIANPWSPEGNAVRMRTKIFYDNEAREHWATGVEKFLSHVNPNTGLALKDDPQMLLVQLRNESELNYLMKSKTYHDPDLIHPFRAWLKNKYKNTDALRAAWNASGFRSLKDGQTLDTVEMPPYQGNAPDTRDLQNYFIDTQRETAAWLAARLEKIGVRVPFTEYNCGIGASALLARSSVPLIDNHTYHDLPIGNIHPGATNKGNDPLAAGMSYYRWLATSRHLGRPFSVSEWGQPFWNSFRHESGMTMPSYAALQNWQILAQHAGPVAFPRSSRNKPYIHVFRYWNDPPLRAAEYMASLLYRRGDVQKSRRSVEIILDEKNLRESGALHQGLSDSLTRLALVSSIGVRVDGPDNLPPPSAISPPDYTLRTSGAGADIIIGEFAVNAAETNRSQDIRDVGMHIAQLRQRKLLPPENRTDPAKGIYESDTGEILLDQKRGSLLVITPNSEAVVLSAAAPQNRLCVMDIKLQPVAVQAGEPTVGATVFLGSLTDEPLEKSRRMLLIIATDALNNGMTFTDATRTKLVSLGGEPVLSRTVKVDLTLRHARAKNLHLFALASNGARREQIPLTSAANGVVTAAINTALLKNGPTPYFELTEGK
ncbi:Zn-dependent oxidoreductase, NADPH:quinone reductase [Opitutaceae bacterium TAV1]|nr:Zn-dependent oxidoreductase, NADPH:quinone reductase [Opitutaceae bacterium TAV1]